MFDNPYTGDVKAMKIRIRTFAKVKDILGADSFLECQGSEWVHIELIREVLTSS